MAPHAWNRRRIGNHDWRAGRGDRTAAAGRRATVGRQRPNVESSTEPGRCLARAVGLAAVTITQPVLDILGRHAEFFVVGGYGRRQIVALSLIVAWAPAALGVAAVAVAGLLGPRVRLTVYSPTVAAFATLFALVVLRHVGVDHVLTTVPLAIALGLATIAAERRSAPFRTFLRYLAQRTSSSSPRSSS